MDHGGAGGAGECGGGGAVARAHGAGTAPPRHLPRRAHTSAVARRATHAGGRGGGGGGRRAGAQRARVRLSGAAAGTAHRRRHRHQRQVDGDDVHRAAAVRMQPAHVRGCAPSCRLPSAAHACGEPLSALHAQLPSGWRACPHAQPGCPTRGAPPAAARQLHSLTCSALTRAGCLSGLSAARSLTSRPGPYTVAQAATWAHHCPRRRCSTCAAAQMRMCTTRPWWR